MKMLKTIFFRANRMKVTLPVVITLISNSYMYAQDPVMKNLRLELGAYYLNQTNEDSYVGNNAKQTLQHRIKQTETKKFITNNNKLKSVKFMTTTAQLLENSLLVIWNDRNADRRLEAMKKTYAPDIHFYEFNAGEAIVGHTEINELISKLQREWPPESKFELNKPSQVNHSVQIASWTLGPQGMQPVATGVDVAVIENDLIKSFYLFLDIPEKSN